MNHPAKSGLARLPRIGTALVLTTVALAALAVSCSGDDAPAEVAPSPTDTTAPPAAAAPTVAPTTAPTTPPVAAPAPTTPPVSAPTAAAPPAPAPSGGAASVTIQEGTMARYLVGEQLARLDVPIDAIGETTRVSGTIVFEDDGNVVSEQSKITVWLPGLRSDEDRRDRWARNELFNVSEYPNAEFTVSSISGLSWPLPDSGTQSFQLAGDLTVRDVSKPVSWDVTAEFSGGAVSGQAKTVVTFDQFELSKPTFAFIISVEDEIRLELDIVASIDSG